MSAQHVLSVWGEFACFTRPELKVERFSYPVITPSAARGVFDAIYCKPMKMRWQVTKVEMLTAPQYIALRRNEVKDKAPSEKTVMGWAAGTSEPQPIWADGDKDSLGTDTKGRTQRQTMALRDVRYRLHARIEPRNGGAADVTAMDQQFRRRASRGQCFWQPYLGCREFPAFFELVEGPESQAPPCDVDIDVGLMLYDVFDLSAPTDSASPPAVSLFKARVVKGVMEVPDYSSEDVLKPAGQGANT